MDSLNICDVSEYGRSNITDEINVNMDVCELERRFQLALINFLENNNFPNQELLKQKKEATSLFTFLTARTFNHVSTSKLSSCNEKLGNN